MQNFSDFLNENKEETGTIRKRLKDELGLTSKDIQLKGVYVTIKSKNAFSKYEKMLSIISVAPHLHVQLSDEYRENVVDFIEDKINKTTPPKNGGVVRFFKLPVSYNAVGDILDASFEKTTSRNIASVLLIMLQSSRNKSKYDVVGGMKELAKSFK